MFFVFADLCILRLIMTVSVLASFCYNDNWSGYCFT